MVFPPSVALLACALLLHKTDAACPSEGPTKNLLCYVEQISENFDPCLCTHLVLQTPLEKLTPQSDLLKTAQILQQKNPALKLIAVASDLAETALKRRDSYAKSVSSVVDKCGLDGVEVDLQWGAKVAGKVQLVDLVQSISKEFKSLEPKLRTKREYKIYEQNDDDVTTQRYTPPNSKSKPRKTRSAEETKKETNTEQKKEDKHTTNRDIILRLSSEPQHLAKNFDLKRLSKYVDLYTIASDNLTDASEHGVTYHPSRLMGIQDILNADSMIDLLTGLGAPHDKLILSLPARALKFTLKDSKKNLPQSPVTGAPKYISQSELCTTMSEGNWTVERDEDLTAPYAFHENTWIAFDDPISTSIKGKYILLRDLAGGAVVSADAEDWSGKCNSSKPAVLATLYDTFTNIARKSRAAQLISLQEELHESAQYSYSGDIHLSPYRIVRVVDRAGDIHVVRKEAKTEFECSRQGYFTHPSGCNRFYRCVKFNQYTPDFTVFEYDCPAGLAFDERYEVCVWPGSLPDGGACQGSSEIAPVPRGRYVCPRVEGYYADPENCRWFFACLDHVRDGATPLTAYEFRCPFGLVFNEKALVCDWPWLVEGCGGAGAFRATFTVGDFYEGRQRASYASLSDVHVSGGRIENVPGGVVLGSSVVGGLASGSNIYSSGAGIYSGGAYDAKGYSGGAYDYSGLSGASLGGAYSAGSGSSNEGGLYVAGGHSSGGSGLYSAGGSSGAYSGSAKGHSGSGLYSADGAYSGGAYSGGAGGLYVAGGNSGAYSGGQGSGYYVADGQSGGSAYSAGSGGVGLVGVKGASGYGSQYGGSSSQYGGSSGQYGGSSSQYGGSSGKYGGANLVSSGVYGGGAAGYSAGSGYVSGGSGQYSQGSSGAYSGGSSGQYVVGLSSVPAYGGVSGSSYEAGKFAGASQSGGYVASGGVGSVGYSGDSGAYSAGNDGYVGVAVDSGKYQGYSGASKGAYSSSSFESQSGNAGLVQVPSYKLSGGYDAGISSTYHGGYGQKSISLKTPSVPVTLVSDAISSGYNQDLSGFNVVAEHKPVNFVNVESVKVTPGSDVISGFGGYSTPAPLPAVSVTPAVSVSTYSSPVTQSPLSISSYRPAVYQPTTPRPTTYYQSSSFAVTPAPVTYQRPVVSVTPTPYVSVTPSPIPVSTYQPAYIKTVTPAPISYRPVSPVLPTVLKTPVVPLNPVQYSTPSPFAFGYSSPAPVQPLQVVSTPAPAPAISSVQFSYPKPTIGLVKTPVVPYNPVSYTFKQPLSTPAPAYISTVTQAPVVYREEYTYQKPIQPVYQKQVPLQPIQQVYQKQVPLQPIQQVYQKQVPLQPIQQVHQKQVPLQPLQPVQPVQYEQPAPGVSYSYTYNKPSEGRVAVTPAPIEINYSPSPATVIKPLEVKYAYPRPAVLKTPIVPLNPIQYSTPAPTFYSSYEQNLPVAPVQPVNYVKSIPRPAFRAPIQYSTPAPIAVEYPSPKPVQFRPAVLKTPVVPLNPVQYTTSAPVYYQSTPAPVTVQYQPSYPKPVPYRPAVLKTPVVPFNPIQYTTSAPVYYQSTPAPVTVQYQPSYPKPVPFRPAVLKTPVVPFNPVQYTTSAPVYFESTPAPVQYLPPRPISSVNFGTGYKLPVKTVTQQPISIDYSYQQPVIKTPVTPVSIDYSSPAPIQQVEVNYNYPKPAVKYVEQPAYVSTTPAPTVYKTVSTVPMYQKVINAFKAPVVSAYQKVLDVISSSTPSTFIQPVTQSPVSYAPVNVGFSYNKPALVKTQSIPVTPVNVVPAYQKVLNVVKASTTPAPLYANHYTSTYEPPLVVSTPRPTVISESSYGLDNSNFGFDGNTDEFYEAVRQDFGSKLTGYNQQFSGYEYAKPVTKFTEGSVQNVPVKQDVSYYTSTTSVPVVQETYRKQVDYEQPAYVGFESGKIAGYDQASYGHVGVGYGGSVGYSQLPVSTTPAPVKQFVQGQVGFEYDGSVGYSQIPVTSTTPAPTVQITTARVSLPVVKAPLPTVDAYYTRRKQARVRPVVVTENYPTSTFKSTVSPSTIFTPTYYSTTPAPVYSSTASYAEELEVEGEDEDDSAKLLEAYNGQYGGVLTKGVSVSGYSGESSTVANIKDGEAIVGVLKKGRVDYTGRKIKSKVVVVSRLSDFNPILVGKLGAECSCSPKSNTVTLRRGKTQLFSPNTYQGVPDQTSTDYVTSTTTLSPESVNGYEEYGASFYSEKQIDNGPIVEIKPLVGRKTYSTTLAPLVDAYSISTEGVYVEPTVNYQAPLVKLPKLRKTIKTVYSENSLRPSYQEVLLPGKVSGVSDFTDAGKSFDRYGPGGLRGVDETLQGSVDCKRAGLFRHPKYCNKFYACNWDQWKGRFTLHVFNCPVHLAYDSGLGACNWPSKGPACADDNLLV